MLSSQTPVLRFSRCGSDQFPCVVGIGGPLHILMKTPGIFTLKGKPRFDRFCHRHFTFDRMYTHRRLKQVSPGPG